jgi:Mrp family chromosome partitioning ATPase
MQLETAMFPRLSVVDPARRLAVIAPCVALSQDYLMANAIFGFEQDDPRAQPFIRMRSSIMTLAKETGQRIFAITSVEPGVGKTHVAVNLAAALSRITATALVELDLRRPSIGARLGLAPPKRGVDDFLDGKAFRSELTVRAEGFALELHCVRTPRANAEQLLTSGRLPGLFEMLRAKDEAPICIIDCSPITVEDDFMLIAPALDGVMMVVEEGRTPRRALLDAVASLKGTPVVGSILNKSMWSAKVKDYYGYRSAARP